MEAALIALVGALLGHFLTARYKSKDRRTLQLSALATFLESTATCLEEMKAQLSSYVVPTAAGNRLKTHFREYEKVIQEADVGERTRSALRGVLRHIRQLLVEGRIEDEVLRGHLLRESEETRMALLLDLERTAARLRGEADSVRAQAT